MRQEFSQLLQDTLAFLGSLDSHEEFAPLFQKNRTQKPLPHLSRKPGRKISLPAAKKPAAPPNPGSEVQKIKPAVQVAKKELPATPPEEKKPFFKLEPLSSPPPLLFEELRTLLKKAAPHLVTFDAPAEDRTARRIKEAWKERSQVPSIAVLLFHEKEEQRTLLKNLSRAIDTVLAPSKPVDAIVLEKEKNWDLFLKAKNLKLVIALESSLHPKLDLMQHYKEYPASQKKLLGAIPLFLLPDLSLYFKDPLLKSSLWKAICSQL